MEFKFYTNVTDVILGNWRSITVLGHCQIAQEHLLLLLNKQEVQKN